MHTSENQRTGTVAVLLMAAFLAAGVGRAETPVTSPALAPSPGDVIAAFDADALDGTIKHISFPKGSATVLLFFSSGCPVCHRMIPEWNRVFERKAKDLAVIGVLMDKEPPGFFMAMPISFPIVRSPGPDFVASLKIHRVPLTVRVGPGGKVEAAAMGVLDPIRLGELFHP